MPGMWGSANATRDPHSSKDGVYGALPQNPAPLHKGRHLFRAEDDQHRQSTRSTRKRTCSTIAAGGQYVCVAPYATDLGLPLPRTTSLPSLVPRKNRQHVAAPIAVPQPQPARRSRMLFDDLDGQRDLRTREREWQQQMSAWENGAGPDPIHAFVMRRTRGKAADKPHKLRHELPPLPRTKSTLKQSDQ